jgi:hypothetical protein
METIAFCREFLIHADEHDAAGGGWEHLYSATARELAHGQIDFEHVKLGVTEDLDDFDYRT